MIFIKRNKQFIFGLLVGGVLFSFGTVYAVNKLNSNGVSVDTTKLQGLIGTGKEANLQNALDGLYTMANENNKVLSVTNNGASYKVTQDGKFLIFTTIYFNSGHAGDNGYLSIRKNGTEIILYGQNTGIINVNSVSLKAGDVISFYAYVVSNHGATFIHNERVVYIG